MVMQENEKRPNAEVDDHIIDRGAQHATGAPGALPESAASGRVLAVSRYTWVAGQPLCKGVSQGLSAQSRGQSRFTF